MRRHYAIWFLLASTIFCLFLAAKRPARAPSRSDIMLAPTMQAHYAEFNKKYFAGRLPKDTAVVWSTHYLRDAGDMGLTIPWKGSFTILLDYQMKTIDYEKVEDGTLIHEMSHVYCYPIMGHGKCFQGNMLRIAKMGGLSQIW